MLMLRLKLGNLNPESTFSHMLCHLGFVLTVSPVLRWSWTQFSCLSWALRLQLCTTMANSLIKSFFLRFHFYFELYVWMCICGHTFSAHRGLKSLRSPGAGVLDMSIENQTRGPNSSIHSKPLSYLSLGSSFRSLKHGQIWLSSKAQGLGFHLQHDRGKQTNKQKDVILNNNQLSRKIKLVP